MQSLKANDLAAGMHWQRSASMPLALSKTLQFIRSKVSQAIVSSFHLCLSASEKPLVLNVPGWIYLPLIVYPENHRWYVKLHLASFT